jgi:prepilin-type N-terminal cleavage/methylation domain-containing protein
MKQKGFTLIELLVTMGIIAVLTGMAVFNFNQSRMRARDVQRKSDLSQLVKALELYKNDNKAFPININSPVPDGKDGNQAMQTELLNGQYIQAIFVDPKGEDWQNYYYNTTSGTSSRNYWLMACLENTSDSTRATADLCSTYFNNGRGAPDQCQCGGNDVLNYTGAMYIITNP